VQLISLVEQLHPGTVVAVVVSFTSVQRPLSITDQSLLTVVQVVMVLQLALLRQVVAVVAVVVWWR